MTDAPNQPRRPETDGADRTAPSGPAAASTSVLRSPAARWRRLDVDGLASVVGAARLLGP
jgi:hypothetical protein